MMNNNSGNLLHHELERSTIDLCREFSHENMVDLSMTFLGRPTAQGCTAQGCLRQERQGRRVQWPNGHQYIRLSSHAIGM